MACSRTVDTSLRQNDLYHQPTLPLAQHSLHASCGQASAGCETGLQVYWPSRGQGGFCADPSQMRTQNFCIIQLCIMDKPGIGDAMYYVLYCIIYNTVLYLYYVFHYPASRPFRICSCTNARATRAVWSAPIIFTFCSAPVHELTEFSVASSTGLHFSFWYTPNLRISL